MKYKRNVELMPSRDALFDVIESLGDIGSEVPRSVENLRVNLRMNPRFLYDDTNVSICVGCGVPMPYRISMPGSKPK